MKRFQTRLLWAFVFLSYGMLPLLPVNAQNATPKPAFEVMTVGPVVYSSHSIDDVPGGTSPNGDGDGRAERGEHVGLSVTVLNQGNETAVGVESYTLTCADADVTILDSANCWPDIPGGQTRENACNYEFQVNPNLAQNKTVTFSMTVTAQNGGPWTSTFPVQIFLQDNLAAPTVGTMSATNVKPTAALLHGLVNPNGASTIYYFAYGTTTNYGSTTGSDNAGSGTSAIFVAREIGNLSPNTTYHFRLVATNSGGTTFGGDLSFRTLPFDIGPLVYSSHSIDDVPGGTSPNGDGDGRAESGEHVGLSVTLLNQGNQTAVGVQSTTLTCSDPDVTIIDSNNCWPDIPGGQTRVNSCNYEFQVNCNLVQNKTVPFTMTVTAQNGGPWTSTFAVQIYLQDGVTAPSNLSANAINNTTVQLNWKDNSCSEQGFKIERKIGTAGSYIEIANVGANVTSYTNGGLTSGTYFYRVRTYVGSIHSDYSNEVSITLPQGVGPVVYSSHSIDDIPGGTSPNGDGDGRAESGEHVGLSVTVLNQGNQTAFGVQSTTLTCSDPDVTIIDANNCWPDIPGGQTRVNSCNYEFQVNPNLAQDKTVTFTMMVTAQNGGPWPSTFSVSIYRQDQLTAPSNLSASVLNSTTVQLNWQDKSSNEQGFKIERKLGVSGTYSEIASVEANNPSYTDRNVSVGQTYVYRVRAYIGSIHSVYSNEANVTIPPTGGIRPVAPTSVGIGTEFTVEVVVNDVQNLFGISFELNYTQTTLVSVVGTPTAGEFMGNDPIFLPTVITSKVSIGVSHKAGQPPSTGSGVVARVRFTSLATTSLGTQVLFTISNIAANDPNGVAIALTPFSHTVTLISPGVPVWPGDTNNDRIVNQADVLPLGLHWSRTGPARPNASMAWIGQPVTPWSPEAATYADANGDGTVNQADVLPIGINWSRTHTFIPATPLAKAHPASSATLLPEINPALALDQEFFIRMNLTQGTDLFGLAFELLYDRPDMLQILSVEPDESFGSNVVFYSKADNAAGKIAVGISRKAGQESVYGSASAVRIKAKFSANARLGETIAFSLANASANDATGQPIEIYTQSYRLTIGASAVVDAENATQLVTDYRLYQNSPNPFNPETLIRYELPEAGSVLLKVYNFTGQEVRTLVNSFQQGGSYQISWDGRDAQGRDLPSGTYLYRLQSGSFSETRKMVLLR